MIGKKSNRATPTKQKKYWVTMTDKFLSGWGEARGKINKLVLECDTMEEAERVARNARARPEMKHINITSRKPYYNPRRYYVSYHDKTDYDEWYKEVAGWRL